MNNVEQETHWLHPDTDLISSHGVSYHVKYLGSVEVLCSMKTLDFDHRTKVARDSILLVCKTIGLAVKDRHRDNNASAESPMIANQANLLHSNTPVELIINTEALAMKRIEDSQILCSHRMEGISFASAGEHETKDYVAYVAKDNMNKRACHVLLCEDNESLDVITTIGQAFELRYNEYIRSQQQQQLTNQKDAFSSLDREKPLKQRHDEDQKGIVSNDDNNQMQSIAGRWNMSNYGDIYREKWFHGKISREEAESMLLVNGDFLVRESTKIPGQYILSGRTKNYYKHLLLVDPDGIIRTKDYEFDSIQHLIAYHKSGNIPIVSADSELLLHTPIPRKK